MLFNVKTFGRRWVRNLYLVSSLRLLLRCTLSCAKGYISGRLLYGKTLSFVVLVKLLLLLLNWKRLRTWLYKEVVNVVVIYDVGDILGCI